MSSHCGLRREELVRAACRLWRGAVGWLQCAEIAVVWIYNGAISVARPRLQMPFRRVHQPGAKNSGCKRAEWTGTCAPYYCRRVSKPMTVVHYFPRSLAEVTVPRGIDNCIFSERVIRHHWVHCDMNWDTFFVVRCAQFSHCGL